ncbi:MAG: Thioredoxin domain-containing protein [uncultured Thiotrichaceae bacterium]|uniref:Thioredoxin n=1 Tax=uncultured Thiotrichaceae bacterium TaxID=298394 RepID=A0A6S6TFZ1_9GAMM|nr:MAG: Thioredoxin domain-containing protein [uncultured Thiotrichaceae bacterium]
MDNQNFVSEAVADTFQQLVIEASFQQPILVDFWADWCQPCKTLMPILSNLAEEYGGKFHLVKVNTDVQRELAMHYEVRSLPTVKVFQNGVAVDEFMGAQPESVIRELINKYLVNEKSEELFKAQAFLAEGEFLKAEAISREIITEQPEYTDAFIIFLQSQIGLDKIELAEQQLQVLPAHILEDENIQTIAKEIKQLKARGDIGDLSDILHAYESNPDDLEALLNYAQACIALGENEKGLDLYITLMKKDPSFADGAAKQGLLDAFELLDAADPLVKIYRNRMFSLLH